MYFNKSDVLSIIVTYNPEDITRLNSVIEVVSKNSDTIIVDNSDDFFSIINLKENILSTNFFFQLLENKGIAFAQNIGFEKAINGNYKFVLLLDDDSIPNKSFIENLIKAHNELTSIYGNHKVGSVSARPLVVTNTKTIDLSNIKINQIDKYTSYSLMNSSGTLISTDVIKVVGNMDEGLFIDLVDFDWGWRAISKKYDHFLCRDIFFEHILGLGTFTIFGINISSGSPIRNYYSYRNCIIMLKKVYVPFWWKTSTFLKMPFKIMYQILFLDSKLVRLKYIYKGIVSGILGEMGKIKI